MINFQIGIVNLPSGKRQNISKVFQNTYGQGNIMNDEILKNILMSNLNDLSFIYGYREVRIGVDQATDQFFSTQLLLR